MTAAAFLAAAEAVARGEGDAKEATRWAHDTNSKSSWRFEHLYYLYFIPLLQNVGNSFVILFIDRLQKRFLTSRPLSYCLMDSHEQIHGCKAVNKWQCWARKLVTRITTTSAKHENVWSSAVHPDLQTGATNLVYEAVSTTFQFWPTVWGWTAATQDINKIQQPRFRRS